MPTDLSKRGRSKSGKRPETQRYPTYVGDLPVKIIQDIIDNLASDDDWETVAGKTGVSARAIQSLKNKQHNRAEMVNIVFEQWLCRIPKPIDLAHLLLTVNRFADTKKLRPFISPEEWKSVEKKMNRLMSRPSTGGPSLPGPSTGGSSLPGPFTGGPALPGPSGTSEVRITSVEESSSVLYPLRSQPTSQPPPSHSDSVSSRASSEGRRPVTEPPPAKPSTLSTTMDQEVPIKVPTANTLPPSSLLPRRPQVSEETASEADYREAHHCLTKYSVAFNFDITSFDVMPNCDHIFTDCRKWVIKLPLARRASVTDLSDSRKSFCREVSALIRLRHPHILPLSGFWDYHGDRYLVYPYMPLGSLESQLTVHPQLREYSYAIWIMLQLASTLSYIHDAGFMHGDLSMSNVLLDSAFHPYLTDFEHATRLPTGRQPPEPEFRAGTVPYMAPPDLPYPSADVDIYAFGILLALVVNQRVWKGGEERGADLVEAVFTVQTAPNLQKSHSHLKSLCLQCVCRSSAERNMGHIEEQLDFAYQVLTQPEYGEQYDFSAESLYIPKGVSDEPPVVPVTDLESYEDSQTDSDD